MKIVVCPSCKRVSEVQDNEHRWCVGCRQWSAEAKSQLPRNVFRCVAGGGVSIPMGDYEHL